MSNLIIYNHVITPDLPAILQKVHDESHAKRIPIIGPIRSNNMKIICPFHSDTNPSGFVYASTDGDIEFGTFHCFSCGAKASLPRLINRLFGTADDAEFGKQWLIDNFSNTFINTEIELPEIILPSGQPKKQYINDIILDQYRYVHPYLINRGISPDVIKEFEVGWNPNTNCVTFPVRDEHGGLVGITERSVENKKFYIPEGMDKPVYLLYYIRQHNINEVYVCESQINALTLWTWGIPAIALFGTGTKEQYEILKKSGIRYYHLCFDGDQAGRKGTDRFINAMYKDCLIDVVHIPEYKDVNDLTRNQFINLWRS